MAGLDVAGADERDVLADERRVHLAPKGGEVRGARRVDRLCAAKGQRDAVGNRTDAAVEQALHGRGHRPGEIEVLGHHLDEAEIGTALDGKREFGTPANSQA